MAISPPSDLVLDVVKAADPMEVQAAQEKLKANRAAFAATSLAENGKGFSNTVDVLDHIGQKSGLANIQNRTKTEEVPESYRKFEAMVLQNFVKSMLPSEGEDVYGKGATGDIWKGMMAEQLGNVMAKETASASPSRCTASSCAARKARSSMPPPTTMTATPRSA